MTHAPRISERFGMAADAWSIVSQPLAIARMLSGRGIDARLRERLMLAVSEVRQCRFCTWFHAREALRAGIDREDVRALLGGSLEAVPEPERAAVVYAQHWADAAGRPDAAARTAVRAQYGEAAFAHIEFALRFILTMNRIMHRFAPKRPRTRGAADAAS